MRNTFSLTQALRQSLFVAGNVLTGQLRMDMEQGRRIFMPYELKNLRSRSACAENPNAEPGKGGQSNNGRKGSPCITPFNKGETKVLLRQKGPGLIRHIWCTVPPGNPSHMRNLILRMYWDGQTCPSVEVPLGDFFGVPFGRQKEMVTEYVSMQAAKGFNCWIPMPFKSEALITVENDSDSDVRMFFYQIDFTLGDELDENTGYFHAQFRRSNPCPLHEDYTIVDGIKGKGVYLGTVLGVRDLYPESWWGEGEFKFYIDEDKEYPTICGTGTEDYMGSAWGLSEVVTPFQGAPLVDWENRLFSLYRFHIKDPIYFHSALKVTVQQIGFGSTEKAKQHYGAEGSYYHAAGVQDFETCYFDRSDDYCSVAYWYQTLPTNPFPVLPDREERSADLSFEQGKDIPKRDDV